MKKKASRKRKLVKIDHRPNPTANWYSGDGRLLAQYLFGCVFPLAQLDTGWPEVYNDLLKVATLLNRNLKQERIKFMVETIYDGLKQRNSESKS